jgi:hypothetical protein
MPPSRRRQSDDHAQYLKGRIAEALVESIFRRAGYVVSRVGRESQVHRLVKRGADEFLPDFLVRKRVARGATERPLHKLVPVEVKYRYDVSAFLRRSGKDLLAQVAQSWPDLCVVLVTDNPASDRSCFQVIDLWRRDGGEPHDLHTIDDLGVFETTVREYESLVKEIFPLLEGKRPTSATALPLAQAPHSEGG